MTYNSVEHMLKNRRYIGEFRYRDVVVPDGIPAIVPRDIFDDVQEKMEKNKKAPARHKAEDDYLLTTKLFCGHCGAYMCGESGTSHTIRVHHYYKCVTVKKKRGDCRKKPVKKEWLENLVVDETMKRIMDDDVVEAIVSQVMDLQEQENTHLPIYEQQLWETEAAINNILDAIQQGILTKSTKDRLETLEATKEDLEIKVANEKLAKPKMTAEQVRYWVTRFRKLDVRIKEHRKMLIDVFLNAVYLYDDRAVVTFNYKDGSSTITFDDINNTPSSGTGSDLESSGAPKSPFFNRNVGKWTFLLYLQNDKVCGNGTRTASRRSDSKCGRIARRISTGQNRIDGRRFHDRHAYDLRGPCRSAYYGIRKIRAIESQQQLAGQVSADLE